MSKSCNNLFDAGKLTILMDGGAGSSGKGKMGSYITENADNWQFACNAFAPQAGHWVRLQDGRQFFYQTLNSCAYNVDKYERIYLGPGAVIELPALLREMEENRVPRDKIRISPITPILQKSDQLFEQGVVGFDQQTAPEVGSAAHDGTAKFGSTCHGVGSVAARRVLRRPSLVMAKDVPELRDLVCDVSAEIGERLSSGQRGFLEIAQGFQLSLMHEGFYPYVTSRNVTVAQALSDMFLPTVFAGQVVINYRTLPIRINSNKYIALDDSRHLTWAEVEAGVPHKVYEGDSGKWYPDQTELTWDQVTKDSGSPTRIFEITSVTKLPRRVASFSLNNVWDSIAHNDTGHQTTLSLNFCNYIDNQMSGATKSNGITEKFDSWMNETLKEAAHRVRFLGTGAATHETIDIGARNNG